jgi:hypothetical protein
MHVDQDRLLRTTFTVNAVATGATGLGFLGAGHLLGPVFGLPPLVLWVLGAGFVAFGLHLAAVLRGPAITRGHALYFALADAAYVAASVVVVMGFPHLMSGLGRLVFAGLADVVALFTIAEFVGYRRLSAPRTATA